MRQRAVLGEAGRPTEVSAVVVCYRSAETSTPASPPSRPRLRAAGEVVVVDNASDDGTLGVLSSHPARPPGHRARRQRRFRPGLPRRRRARRGRRLLLVNPDALVDPHTVRALLAAAVQHPDAGVLGGRALRRDGTTDPRSWWGRPTLWSTLCFATGLSSLFAGHPLLDPEAPDRWDGSAREVPVVSGALMLVDRAVWAPARRVRPRHPALRRGRRPVPSRAAGGLAASGGAATRRSGTPSGPRRPGPTRTVLVMRGRASVLRRHLRPGTRRLGVGLLVSVPGCARPAPVWRPVLHPPPSCGRHRRCWVAGGLAASARLGRRLATRRLARGCSEEPLVSARGRVLIIVQNLPVLIDRRVWSECQALRDNGYQVSVVCPSGAAGRASAPRRRRRAHPLLPAAGAQLGRCAGTLRSSSCAGCARRCLAARARRTRASTSSRPATRRTPSGCSGHLWKLLAAQAVRVRPARPVPGGVRRPVRSARAAAPGAAAARARVVRRRRPRHLAEPVVPGDRPRARWRARSSARRSCMSAPDPGTMRRG